MTITPTFLKSKTTSTKVKSLKVAHVLGLGDDVKENHVISTEPDDLFRNPLYYDNKFIKAYLCCSMFSYEFTHKNENFNFFMTFVIIVAGILVGVESYPGMISNRLSAQLDILIITIFLAELLLKILVEGVRPWR